MKNYTVYNSSGVIMKTGACPDNVFNKQAGDGLFIIPVCANDLTEYVELATKTIKPKPISPISIDKLTVLADNTDIVLLLDTLPDSRLQVTGEGVNIDQQIDVPIAVSLSFALPGEYKIKVSKFPYLDFEVKVNAT